MKNIKFNIDNFKFGFKMKLEKSNLIKEIIMFFLRSMLSIVFFSFACFIVGIFCLMYGYDITSSVNHTNLFDIPLPVLIFSTIVMLIYGRIESRLLSR